MQSLGEKLNGHLTRMGVEGVDGRTLFTRPFTPATPKRQLKSPALMVRPYTKCLYAPSSVPPPPPSPSLLLSLLQCPLRPPPPLGLDGVAGPVSPARSDGSCFSNHLNTSFRSNGEEGHRDDEDAEAEGYASPQPPPLSVESV